MAQGTETELIKVLVVDDDPMITEVIESKLTKTGHEVVVVLDPENAMTEAQRFMPQAIVLDLMMTKLSGEELLRMFKADKDLHKIPVIVFSNKGTEQDMNYLETKGAAKCLIKADTSLSELVEVIDTIVAEQ